MGKPWQAGRRFPGLGVPPVFTTDQPGREFVLRGHDLGSLDQGDGVYFRRGQVGQVTAAELDKDGNGVTVKIFVNAPYDQYVTTNTRFWHASGIDLSLDTSGFKVHTQSLAAIILGGIAFQTPPGIAVSAPAEADAVFTLFSDRAQAMRLPDTTVKSYAVVFDESLRGLEPGSPVDFRGVLLGEVKEIGVQYNPVGKQIQMRVEVLIFRDRLISRMKMMAPEAAPEARATLAEARKTLGTAERTLNRDAPLQVDARQALREISRAAQALRALSDYLERHPEALIRGKKEQKP